MCRRPISRRRGRPMGATWGSLQLRDRPTGATDATDRRVRRMGGGWRGYFPRCRRAPFMPTAAGGQAGRGDAAKMPAPSNKQSRPRHRGSQGRDAGRVRPLAITAASRGNKKPKRGIKAGQGGRGGGRLCRWRVGGLGVAPLGGGGGRSRGASGAIRPLLPPNGVERGREHGGTSKRNGARGQDANARSDRTREHGGTSKRRDAKRAGATARNATNGAQ